MNEEHVKMVPIFKDKAEIVNLLKTKEAGGMSWTAFITGAFFDFVMRVGFASIYIPKREAQIFDSGDVKWHTTILPTVALAVTNLFTIPGALEKCKDRHVVISSFKTSQNEVVATLEKITGDKFKTAPVDGNKVGKEAQEKAAKGDFSMIKELITYPILSLGMADHDKLGSDNDLLLPGHHDNLEEVLRGLVKEMDGK